MKDLFDSQGETSDGALVELIYGCVRRDDLLRILLKTVAERFGATSAILVYFHPGSAVAAFTLAYGVIDDPDVQSRYNSDFAALDPAPAAMSNLKPGQAASTDLIFANSMDRCKPFIEGFLHPIGLGGCMAGVVAKGGGKTGFFAVYRPRARRIFDEADVAAFEGILRHVVQMLDLRQHFYSMASQIEAQARALDRTGTAIMLFGADRQLVQANTASRAILARDDGLRISALGLLTVQDGQAKRMLEEAFSSYSEGCTIIVVKRRGAALPYILRTSKDDSSSSQHLSIHIWDPERRSGNTSMLLQDAFGLTPSSARLVTALLDGETLETYAARSGLSRSTAKFHLNAAFDATGTRRQSELVRLAVALVCDLSPLRLDHVAVAKG